jgi:hypothetical protein
VREALRLLPTVRPDTLKLSSAWAIVFSDGRTWLVGSYLASQPVDSIEDSELSVLVLAPAGERHSVPLLTWSHLGGETSRQVRNPVDAIDLDRDGVPELITRTTYYESMDYQIWSLRGSAWVELASSLGGSGC